jgi:hypothetical protein
MKHVQSKTLDAANSPAAWSEHVDTNTHIINMTTLPTAAACNYTNTTAKAAVRLPQHNCPTFQQQRHPVDQATSTNFRLDVNVTQRWQAAVSSQPAETAVQLWGIATPVLM